MRLAFRVTIAAIAISSAALADELPFPRDHHPWGHFPVGSWKKVRTTAELLDDKEQVVNITTTDTTTRLVAVDATSYTLERTEPATPGAFTQVGGSLTANSYADTDVEPGVAYGYRVSAVNAIGSSEWAIVVAASLARPRASCSSDRRARYLRAAAPSYSGRKNSAV